MLLLLLIGLKTSAKEVSKRDTGELIPIYIDPDWEVQHAETFYGTFVITSAEHSASVLDYVDSLEHDSYLLVLTERELDRCTEIQSQHDRQVQNLQEQITQGSQYIKSAEREKQAILNQKNLLTEENKQLFTQTQDLKRRLKANRTAKWTLAGVGGALVAGVLVAIFVR